MPKTWLAAIKDHAKQVKTSFWRAKRVKVFQICSRKESHNFLYFLWKLCKVYTLRRLAGLARKLLPSLERFTWFFGHFAKNETFRLIFKGSVKLVKLNGAFWVAVSQIRNWKMCICSLAKRIRRVVKSVFHLWSNSSVSISASLSEEFRIFAGKQQAREE